MSKDYRPLQNGSDIRGIALEGIAEESVNLTTDAVHDLAIAFALWLHKHTGKDIEALTVAVGRDPRLSGEALCASFEQALSEVGIRVLSCGLASTPAMYMSCIMDGFMADGACMITASHLPWNRNGLKLFSRTGGLEAQDIASICDLAASDAIETCTRVPQPQAAEQCDVLDAYASHLRSIICKGLDCEDTADTKPLQGLNICVDAGNGSAGFYATQVLEPLGADVSASQFLEPDGNFPNHMPNPENKEAMDSISARVKECGCDLGLIFDTDVDRASAVDSSGNEINRNSIIALSAALIAEEHPGTTVVTDSVTSDELTAFLEAELGLHHLRYKRGYRNVINKMIELNHEGTNCQLAIETSGHAAFLENYSLDDGAYLATRIVVKAAELAQSGQSISDLLAQLAHPQDAAEIRLPITSDDFQAQGTQVLEHLTQWVCGTGAEVAQASGIELALVEPNFEGVRVALSGEVHGWFLLRQSLHDPLMPLNIETREHGGVQIVRALVRRALQAEAGLDISML